MSSPDTRPVLHIADMSPLEATLLHPDRWGGHSAGVGTVGQLQRHRILHSLFSSAVGGSFVCLAAERALIQAAQGGYPAGAIWRFGPGETFFNAEFAGQLIILDRSTLVTQGSPFRIDPAEFADGQPSQLELRPSVTKPIVHRNAHSVYVHERATVHNGAIITAVEKHVNNSYAQIGHLAMPEVIEVGTVEHYYIGRPQDAGQGHEMLARTHNVYVFPDRVR